MIGSRDGALWQESEFRSGETKIAFRDGRTGSRPAITHSFNGNACGILAEAGVQNDAEEKSHVANRHAPIIQRAQYASA
jgi:hypothetical protein